MKQRVHFFLIWRLPPFEFKYLFVLRKRKVTYNGESIYIGLRLRYCTFSSFVRIWTEFCTTEGGGNQPAAFHFRWEIRISNLVLRPLILFDVLRGFPQCLRKNSWTVFHLHSLSFVNRQLSFHCCRTFIPL